MKYIFQVFSLFVVLNIYISAEEVNDVQHPESFIHFLGPVEDQYEPFVYKDKHGREIVDFVANPKYEYMYGVADPHSGDFHSQKETHDGHQVVGEYTLKEPSGNIRTVRYIADDDGFHAEVLNSLEEEQK